MLLNSALFISALYMPKQVIVVQKLLQIYYGCLLIYKKNSWVYCSSFAFFQR